MLFLQAFLFHQFFYTGKIGCTPGFCTPIWARNAHFLHFDSFCSSLLMSNGASQSTFRLEKKTQTMAATLNEMSTRHTTKNEHHASSASHPVLPKTHWMLTECGLVSDHVLMFASLKLHMVGFRCSRPTQKRTQRTLQSRLEL